MAPLPPPSMPTVDAIFRAYEAASRDGFREHLGASLIGRECERALWLGFRWARVAQHAGRILRLFQTGHMEEARMIKDLRAAGVTVMDVDPETGRQWSVSAVRGHFGGSADGIAIGLLEAPKTAHLTEFKTHNLKSFNALQKHGVAKHKPEHAAQMQVYMSLLGLTRGYYLAVCKDNDALYSERVEADPVAAARLLAKAERIIDAKQPPERLNEDHWLCKLCDYRGQCWGDEKPARTCRTCIHSTPADSGKWTCALRDNAELSSRQQRTGCVSGEHRYVPGMIRGEQIDVTADDGVVYRIADGEWVDTGV